MGVAKVTLNGETLMDVTDKTVAADKMLSSYTALNKAGDSVTGSIATKTSSNLTASGATVTAPAGYYASNATKTISSGSATGPTNLSASSATVSTGTNTLTLTKTGVTTTPTVSAGYVSSATASTATVALTASVTTKAAATITPGTSNQTIASGTYLTGAQTISGDSNLVSGNIKNGVSIFGVTGSLVSDPTLQEKTAWSSTTENEITADTGYDGLSKVTIKPYKLQTKTVTPSSSQQTITPDEIIIRSTNIDEYALTSNPMTLSVSEFSSIVYGKDYYVTGFIHTKAHYSRSSGYDQLIFDTVWTASADGDVPFTFGSQGDQYAHPIRVTFSQSQIKVYYPDGTTISRGAIVNNGAANTKPALKDISASYDGLSQVTVEGAGSGVQYGTFTTIADSNTTVAYVYYVTYANLGTYYDYYKFPVLVKVSTTSKNGLGVIESDGYMHVTFQGASDKYTPVVTATSGTAEVVTSFSAGTQMDNFDKYGCAVCYRVSQNAVLNVSYRDNS